MNEYELKQKVEELRVTIRTLSAIHDTSPAVIAAVQNQLTEAEFRLADRACVVACGGQALCNAKAEVARCSRLVETADKALNQALSAAKRMESELAEARKRLSAAREREKTASTSASDSVGARNASTRLEEIRKRMRESGSKHLEALAGFSPATARSMAVAEQHAERAIPAIRTDHIPSGSSDAPAQPSAMGREQVEVERRIRAERAQIHLDQQVAEQAAREEADLERLQNALVDVDDDDDVPRPGEAGPSGITNEDKKLAEHRARKAADQKRHREKKKAELKRLREIERGVNRDDDAHMPFEGTEEEGEESASVAAAPKPKRSKRNASSDESELSDDEDHA